MSIEENSQRNADAPVKPELTSELLDMAFTIRANQQWLESQPVPDGYEVLGVDEYEEKKYETDRLLCHLRRLGADGALAAIDQRIADSKRARTQAITTQKKPDEYITSDCRGRVFWAERTPAGTFSYCEKGRGNEWYRGANDGYDHCGDSAMAQSVGRTVALRKGIAFLTLDEVARMN